MEAHPLRTEGRRIVFELETPQPMTATPDSKYPRCIQEDVDVPKTLAKSAGKCGRRGKLEIPATDAELLGSTSAHRAWCRAVLVRYLSGSAAFGWWRMRPVEGSLACALQVGGRTARILPERLSDVRGKEVAMRTISKSPTTKDTRRHSMAWTQNTF